MDNYKEYIEERLDAVYESYDSVILEAHKAKSNKGQKAKFVNFLKGKGKDKEYKKDVKEAKTLEQRKGVVKKWLADFKEWSTSEDGKKGQMLGMIAGAGYAKIFGSELAVALFIFSWGAHALGNKIADKVIDKIDK